MIESLIVLVVGVVLLFKFMPKGKPTPEKVWDEANQVWLDPNHESGYITSAGLQPARDTEICYECRVAMAKAPESGNVWPAVFHCPKCKKISNQMAQPGWILEKAAAVASQKSKGPCANERSQI